MSPPVDTPTRTDPPAAEASERPQRADARRNRERVIEAARDCFAADGLDAQMDDVARCAGVGVGTVYRHFPTKAGLVQALAEQRFAALAAEAIRALDVEDPWEAFSGFIWRAAEIHAEDRALQQVMGAVPGAIPAAAAARTDLQEAITKLIRRAQRAGELRRDVGPEDIPMLMCGISRIQGADPGPPMSWRRYLAIVLDGMRGPARSRLPK
jgi:AcrR family transcriptional regulator